MEEKYLEKLKELYRKLFHKNHRNESPEEVKQGFTKLIKDIATNQRKPPEKTPR